MRQELDCLDFDFSSHGVQLRVDVFFRENILDGYRQGRAMSFARQSRPGLAQAVPLRKLFSENALRLNAHGTVSQIY